MPAPCGVPMSVSCHSSLSRMPASSHWRAGFEDLRSCAPASPAATRGQPGRRKRRQTTHRRDLPDSVTITRERHPFEGRPLAVISSIRRGGVLFLLVSLPDGSRSLVPAQWTHWAKGDAGGARALPDDDTALRSLGSLADLLGLRHLVDALRSRSIGSVPQTESRHATDPGLSRPARSTSGRSFGKPRADPLGTTRRSGAQRSARDSRAPHRPHARGSGERGEP